MCVRTTGPDIFAIGLVVENLGETRSFAEAASVLLDLSNDHSGFDGNRRIFLFGRRASSYRSAECPRCIHLGGVAIDTYSNLHSISASAEDDFGEDRERPVWHF